MLTSHHNQLKYELQATLDSSLAASTSSQAELKNQIQHYLATKEDDFTRLKEQLKEDVDVRMRGQGEKSSGEGSLSSENWFRKEIEGIKNWVERMERKGEEREREVEGRMEEVKRKVEEETAVLRLLSPILIQRREFEEASGLGLGRI